MEHIEPNQFLTLSRQEVANIVRDSGTKVCVFPLNGTRRWFLLEHGQDFNQGEKTKSYIELTAQGYINTFKLLFDHGIDILLSPVFGADIFARGEEYMREIGMSMALLATHRAFIEFYDEYDIRIHFYGDYRKQLSKTSYAYICDSFDEITQQTALHTHRRLFYGVCAEDVTTTMAELSIQYYQNTGNIPSRHDLVENYYGEYLEKADLFIGFEKFTAFDYPLLSLGDESLYFTAAPSLYMNERQLRTILYDHIYLRPTPEPDYFMMPTEDFNHMRQYYEANRETTFGIGEVKGGIWYAKSDTRE
jgi:tuberculosinol/isotuberculosinol synthase